MISRFNNIRSDDIGTNLKIGRIFSTKFRECLLCIGHTANFGVHATCLIQEGRRIRLAWKIIMIANEEISRILLILCQQLDTCSLTECIDAAIEVLIMFRFIIIERQEARNSRFIIEEFLGIFTDFI